MKIVRADDRRRVRLLAAKPGQAFACSNGENGVITLTPVKADAPEPFPKGSLVRCVDEWNRQWARKARTVKVPAPPRDLD